MLRNHSRRSILFCAVTLVFGFLATRFAIASDETPIVGRWDVVRSGQNSGKDVSGYMRFNKDGTFTSTLLFLATTDGKYKFLSTKVIELDFPGVLYGRNKVEFKYLIMGTGNTDTLNLEGPNNMDLEFTRVDSGK